MNAFTTRKDGDTLRCVLCGRQYDALARSCASCDGALLRMSYARRRFQPMQRTGIFKYLHWLPSRRGIETEIGPVVYQSEGLAGFLGLRRLYIGINGYCPERGAFNITGTFKDFEALPTLLYLQEHGVTRVILASAGNTGRAFAYAARMLGFRLDIIVPEAMAHKLWLPVKPAEAVRLTVVADSRDYSKAIELCGLAAREFGIPDEGGARNVARRDGMGTAMLEYARIVGALPDHYFQAVGSGTGAIAAWEASLRLIADGRFGDRLPRLHLAQNAPFTPIHDAWTNGKKIHPRRNIREQLARIARIKADVLANRNPPFSVAGGVRDALEATNGLTYSVTNREASAACKLFERTECFTPSAAASVAVAALVQAVRAGRIGRDDAVFLHVTGGGLDRLRKDYHIHRLQPGLRVPVARVTARSVSRLGGWFAS